MYKKITIGAALIAVGILLGTKIERLDFAIELKKRSFG